MQTVYSTGNEGVTGISVNGGAGSEVGPEVRCRRLGAGEMEILGRRPEDWKATLPARGRAVAIVFQRTTGWLP